MSPPSFWDKISQWGSMLQRVPVPIVVAGGYALYILVAWAALQLPFAHTGDEWSVLDDLFMATSAVSTTGLSVASARDDYSFFGQLVIFSAFQAGGLGYMTLSSFLALGLQGGQLGGFRQKMTRSVFPLPEGTSVKTFVQSVIAYTLICELCGALVLSYRFHIDGHEDPIWLGVFHSVSAFCTAGFSLFDQSFVAYANDGVLNATIALLSLAGAVGFIVVNDVALGILRRYKRKISLTSRAILIATLASIGLSTVIYRLVQPGPVLEAFFQTMSAATTVGFSTQSMSAATPAASWVIIALMLIGAAPSGTGGGLKSTTVMALFALTISNFRRRRIVSLLGRTLPERRLREAASVAFLYIGTLWVGVLAVSGLQPELDFTDVLFETVSALGTVGLSRGITSDLGGASECVVMGLMFVGRVGPMTTILALGEVVLSDELSDAPKKEEDLAV